MKTILSAVLFAATTLAGTAGADPVRFSVLDRDGDGRLSRAELSRGFGPDGARAYLRATDRDRDGLVTIRELRASDDDDDDDGHRWGGRDDDDDDRDDDRGDDDDGDDD